MNIEPKIQIPVSQRIQAGIRMSQRHITGERPTDIALDMGISHSYLYVLERKYNEDPMMVNKAKSGRPKKIDVYVERRVVREIKRNPFQSSTKIARIINIEIEEQANFTPKR